MDRQDAKTPTTESSPSPGASASWRSLSSTQPLALSATASLLRSSVFADLAARIDARTKSGGDLVELHIGDCHRAPPETARFGRLDEEGHDASLYRYGAIAGLESLKEAFAARLAANAMGPAAVDPATEVLVSCGATHAIFCAARAILDPGDEVLVAAPYWPLSVGVLRAAGAVPIEVPLTTRLYANPNADAAEAFERAFTPKTRALYLITPNNPDGKVLSRAHLDRIAEFARARHLWVVADEVYADYVYEGAHTSIARLDGMRDRTLSIYSLSKSHALAGARVGFAVGPSRVIDVARRIATHTVFNVPVATQRIALAALQTPPIWTDTARLEFRAAREDTLRAMDGSGVLAQRPDGGSYLFVDFAPVLDGRPLQELLERAIDRGVLLAPGSGFGDAFGTWARLCFTSVPRTRLLEGVARLREAIRDLTS
jgi:aspartate/methionine/tyrosine aminotransferase